MMNALEGTVAIVSGASSPNGIGRATAHCLAKYGASVIVSDIAGPLATGDGTRERMDLLDELADDITRDGGTGAAVAVDVTKADHVARAVALAEDRFGRLDILVNNAGTTVGTGPFLDTTEDDWRTSFEVNLLGAMLFTRAAVPALRRAGGGSIVNVGSTGSLGAEAGFGAYTAMKHGLIGLTKTVAAEFGPDGIRCNAVCPGYVMTDMHAGANARIAGETGQSLEETMEKRYVAVALRRAGEPAEVAETIAYLARPEAAYITGVALPVAGGLPAGL
jgi:3-oxoacyl-[acyl-carrier protein] reductase